MLFIYPLQANMQVNDFVLKIETAQKTFATTSETIAIDVLGNRNIISLPQTAFILDGARISSLRKISPQKYILKILPDENTNKVFLQIEADAVESALGKNLIASNELLFFRTRTAVEVETDESLEKNSKYTEGVKNASKSSQEPAFKNTGEFISFLKSIQPDMNDTIYTRTLDKLYVAKKLISSLRGVPTSLQSAFSDNYLNGVVAMRNFITSELVEDLPTLTPNIGLATKKSQIKNLNQQIKYQNGLISNNYFILGHIGYLPFSASAVITNTPKKFNREDLDADEISCSKIITFNNNAVYELHEDSQNFTFRMNRDSKDVVRLLAYRNDAFDFWQYSCFVEEELADRYFPNGLFCCTDNYCNTKKDIYPIVYKDSSGHDKQVTRIYSTDLLQNNNIITSGLLSASPCVNYKRYPNLLKRTSNSDPDYYPQGQYGGQI